MTNLTNAIIHATNLVGYHHHYLIITIVRFCWLQILYATSISFIIKPFTVSATTACLALNSCLMLLILELVIYSYRVQSIEIYCNTKQI